MAPTVPGNGSGQGHWGRKGRDTEANREKTTSLCAWLCLFRNAVLSVQLSGAIAKESALAFRYVTRGINPKFKRDTAANFTLLT